MIKGEYQSPPDEMLLPKGVVHIWRMQVDTAFSRLAQLRQYLSEQECAKVDRLIRPVHQQRAGVAYAALRAVLSCYVRVAKQELVFTKGSHGKPYLDGSDGVYFNMTHSGSMLLIAVMQDCEVGVDVERVDENIEFLKLAERFFAEPEYLALEALPKKQQLRAFYRCWTRKEAYIKAIGLGLSFALKDFVVSLQPDGLNCLLSVKHSDKEAKKWSLGSVYAAPGFEATIALPEKLEGWELFDLDLIL